MISNSLQLLKNIHRAAHLQLTLFSETPLRTKRFLSYIRYKHEETATSKRRHDTARTTATCKYPAVATGIAPAGETEKNQKTILKKHSKRPFKTMWEFSRVHQYQPEQTVKRSDELYYKAKDPKTREFKQTWADYPEMKKIKRPMFNFETLTYGDS